MNRPPEEIDGAKVLFWAWSGSLPFGKVSGIEIYGLALCQYENTEDIYRFSCDENWKTQQDDIYGSVEESKECLPQQYQNVVAQWIQF